MVVSIRGPGKVITKNNAKSFINRRFTNNKNVIFFKTAVGTAFLNNRSFNYSIFNNNKLVGFALVTPEGKILNLEVIVTNSGKGYGKNLINKLKTNGRVQGFSKIYLNSVNSAINFYKKLGFQQVGPKSFSFLLNNSK